MTRIKLIYVFIKIVNKDYRNVSFGLFSFLGSSMVTGWLDDIGLVRRESDWGRDLAICFFSSNSLTALSLACFSIQNEVKNKHWVFIKIQSNKEMISVN